MFFIEMFLEITIMSVWIALKCLTGMKTTKICSDFRFIVLLYCEHAFLISFYLKHIYSSYYWSKMSFSFLNALFPLSKTTFPQPRGIFQRNTLYFVFVLGETDLRTCQISRKLNETKKSTRYT